MTMRPDDDALREINDTGMWHTASLCTVALMSSALCRQIMGIQSKKNGVEHMIEWVTDFEQHKRGRYYP